MRLTLRTMLAYMDDILEPEHAQALGKRIEESERAANLLVRIRDVTRRLRLGAPNVGERGAMFDPNTVAEYLDNTLAGDRVPDFERVCLESDMHLAEVAACHQVLTLVLGEPAEVDPESRQRMYQLPSLAATQPAAPPEEKPSPPPTPGGDGAARTEQSPAQPKPERPAIPDYLREPPARRRFWPVAAALFLAGFLTVVVLALLGQFAPDKPLGKLLGIPQPEVAQQPESPDPEQPSNQASEEEGGTELEQPEGVKPGPDPKDGAPDGEQPPLPEDVGAGPPAPAEERPMPAAKADENGGESGPDTKTPPNGESIPPSKPGPDVVGPLVKPGGEDAQPGPTAKPDEAMAEAPKPKPADAAPLPPELVGRLVSDREVLLTYDAKQAAWMRVPSQGSIAAGQTFLALPTFRPILGLSVGLTIRMTGGTEIDLVETDADGAPGLSVVYGQLLISTVGKADTRLRLTAGQVSGVLTLVDQDSAVAVAVSRDHVPGRDPETRPDPTMLEIYARTGRFAWTPTEGGQALMAQVGEQLTLGGAEVPQPRSMEEAPAWLTEDTAAPLDRRASPEIEAALALERPARIGLLELLDHRQREVRWLAARSLGYLGEYQLMVAGLNSPDERLVWNDYIEQLREAVLRGPGAAGAVREAMVRQFGQEGADLYRMLLGYSNEGLGAGEAEQLVNHLEHSELAFRVISFWNLRSITGLGLFYQPEAPEARRRQSVAKWRERLSAGEIVRPDKKGSTSKPPASKPVPSSPDTPGADAPSSLPPAKPSHDGPSLGL